MMEVIIPFVTSFVVGMLGTYMLLDLAYTKIQKKLKEFGYIKV